jgi:hypothetical protein
MLQVDGGQPMDIDGPLMLCDRADRLAGRTFDGSIAQLAIFNAALSENNVRAPLTCHTTLPCHRKVGPTKICWILPSALVRG